MDVVIYHNPACGTSRNTLALIRHAGIEPHVVEYLKTPPSRALLLQLVERMGVRLHDILRTKQPEFAQMGLAEADASDERILDAIEAYPVLINRPIVVTPLGVRLCRPSEVVLDILPETPMAPFAKEDGEVIIDDTGRRVR
ncbi:arsenate reductase (glutaredoxin) [Brevundimonas sp.]|uniref:arsenate reductase (glutaredoxin) n=1 Tax=Brevundimonas sp. TaxID=1871086 RepID=UPI0035AF66B0